MAYYFLFSTSAFIHWASESGGDSAKYARKLFHILKQYREAQENIRVEVTKETDKDLYETCKSMGHPDMFNVLKEHYDEVARDSDGSEHEALVRVAKREAATNIQVIIVNGSNAIELGEVTEEQKKKIQILSEKDAYEFTINSIVCT